MQMFCTAGIFLWIFGFSGPYPGSAPDQRAVNLIIVIHDRAGGSCYWLLHCTTLTTLHCTTPTTLHCTALQCTALPSLQCTALPPLHCTALPSLQCTAFTTMHYLSMHCTALRYNALHSLTLHCTEVSGLLSAPAPACIHCCKARYTAACTVRCAVYRVNCAVWYAQSTLCSALCTEQIVQCAVDRVHCAV